LKNVAIKASPRYVMKNMRYSVIPYDSVPEPFIKEVIIDGKSMVTINNIENIPANKGNNNSSLSFIITSKLNFVIFQLLENVSNKMSTSAFFLLHNCQLIYINLNL
jgi:hypothetical protein